MKGLRNFFMQKNKEIEQIYVCKNSNSVISKFLIKFLDGSYNYYKLSSFYSELTCKNKMKELKKLMKKLEFYLKQFQKQKNLDVDCFDHKDLIICSESSFLETYVNMIITAINKENDLKLSNSENTKLKQGTFFSFLALLYVLLKVPISTHLSTIVSEAYFICSIYNNKNRSRLKTEEYFIKKLKLYFSYFMFSLNIGLNFVDFDYDSSKNELDINIDKPEFLKDESEKISDLMKDVKLNAKLSKEDVAVIFSLEEFMLENPYFDYEGAYDSLTPLEVEYSSLSRGNVAGAYYSNLDLIRIYNSLEITKEEKEKIIQHELIHSVGGLGNITLNEGMTSLIQAEYFNDGVISDGYYDHVWLTRIFCELITPEKMLEAYSKDNMSIIEEEMLKINTNKEDYKRLISVM